MASSVSSWKPASVGRFPLNLRDGLGDEYRYARRKVRRNPLWKGFQAAYNRAYESRIRGPFVRATTGLLGLGLLGGPSVARSLASGSLGSTGSSLIRRKIGLGLLGLGLGSSAHKRYWD